MKSNRALVKYKHNIIGKVRDIDSVIGKLDDSKECSEDLFVPFSLVHGDIIRMITSSKEVIGELFQQKSVLNVVRELPSVSSLRVMKVEGIEIHYENSIKGWSGYFVVLGSEETKIAYSLGKLNSLLQHTQVKFQLNDLNLEERLQKLI
jgi:hypothetical protein